MRHWKHSEDSYNQEWQYVEDTGRIVGVVTGSAYRQAHGWNASAERPGKVIPLGRFTTVDQAKAVVVTYWMEALTAPVQE